MSDNDLIRRKDALAAVQGLEYSCNAEEDIAALPAVTVGVPDDVRDYAIAVSEAFDTMMEVALNPFGAWQVIQAMAGHIAALSRALDPDLRPTMTDMMVDPNTLDAFMEANPLPPDPAAIREAWEKAYWRMRSYAVHDDACKLNKPPHFDGPCSCGLTDALQDALALIQKGDTNV